jgi:hypothetical protein
MLHRDLLVATSVLLGLLPGPARAADEPDAVYFEKRVLPILEAKCFKCHGVGETQGELVLTSRAAILKGGEGGEIVDLKQPQESRLLVAVNFEDEFFQMPPTGKIAANQIAVLTEWVKRGVPFPENLAREIANRPPDHHAPPTVNDETRAHWAFVPVRRPDVPQVMDTAWPANAIDAFLLAKLEAKGLQPAADLLAGNSADRAALLRRLYYDLIGLPPTPEEVEAFVTSDEADAKYARIVDELLESPHYGEKWGRHWLDLVHYAETNSFERDNPKPEVWRYRDWVVGAFNDDLPFDEFVRQQLAGDEIDRPTVDSIVATGYYRLGLWDDESADPPQTRYDELDDFATTTAQGFLGLTINCCRCHDHKLDPLPQADYYRFLAFFRDVESFQQGRDGMTLRFKTENFHVNVTDLVSMERHAEFERRSAELDAEIDERTRQLDAIVEEIRPHLPGGVRDDVLQERRQLRILEDFLGDGVTRQQKQRFEQLHREREQLRREQSDVGLKVLAVRATPKPAQTHVMTRGNPHSPGEQVEPGIPQILGGDELEITPRAQSAGRRIALANWIASPDNPLTARVFVNRIWQYHFGRGIVRSPNNFGLQGDAPTHPELLDWLAAEFVAGDWQVKRMHRLLLLSSAYRMASTHDAAAFEVDPENDLYWRFDPRRLTAEEMRDSILAMNGRLNLAVGGESVYPPIPEAILQGQSRPGSGWPVSGEPARYRRSLYIHVKRSLLHPLLEGFDFADTDNTCPVRFVTTQPTQSLTMLNGEFTGDQARAFARRLLDEAPNDTARQVERGLELATQRPVKKEEIDRGIAFVESLETDEQLSHAESLGYFCLMLLNLNEFVYVD